MSKLFPAVLIVVIVVKLHSDVGSIPDSWLLCKSKTVIAVKYPNEDGTTPMSEFELR